MIAVDNLKMQFGSEEILKGISTVFEQGKTNLIIGQSGSGKSVMLKCLIGLLKPVAGTISYHNKPTHQMNLRAATYPERRNRNACFKEERFLIL